MKHALGIALVAVLAVVPQQHVAAAGDGDAKDVTRETLAELRKLSMDVRNIPLSADEIADVRTRLAQSNRDAVYQHYVETWLADVPNNGAFVNTILPGFLPDSLGGGPVFFNLEQFKTPEGKDVLYLPKRHKDKSVPCSGAKAIVSVRPWWSKTPVQICADSYVPEVSFVNGTFCPQALSGGGGYRVPDECACGPRLMHCAPPHDLDPALADAIESGPENEVVETTIDLLLRKRRPLQDIFTTTTTWQNGVVRFLYARREAAALLAKSGYTKAIAKKIDAILDKVDVRAKPAWVERGPDYRGAGLYLTTTYGVQSTYRNTIRQSFNDFLCIDFGSLRVDRDALLATVQDKFQNTRALDAITDSPMRHSDGCKGCHMPMDTSAGFLYDFELSWRGGFHRTAARPSELYVSGALDRRGNGKGIASLMRLLTSQPEFESCAVQKMLVNLAARGPTQAEKPEFNVLVDGFRKQGNDFIWLVKAVLNSKIYREDM
jgi:hypothetical protein